MEGYSGRGIRGALGMRLRMRGGLAPDPDPGRAALRDSPCCGGRRHADGPRHCFEDQPPLGHGRKIKPNKAKGRMRGLWEVTAKLLSHRSR